MTHARTEWHHCIGPDLVVVPASMADPRRLQVIMVDYIIKESKLQQVEGVEQRESRCTYLSP